QLPWRRRVRDVIYVSRGFGGVGGRCDEAREKVREVVEGIMPGLPEPYFAVKVRFSQGQVKQLSGTLGDPVLRVAEKKRLDQLRIRLVLPLESGERVPEQVFQLRDPACGVAACGRQVLVGQPLQFGSRHRALVVRADVEPFYSALSARRE